jgi:hypothetical protein
MAVQSDVSHVWQELQTRDTGEQDAERAGGGLSIPGSETDRDHPSAGLRMISGQVQGQSPVQGTTDDFMLFGKTPPNCLHYQLASAIDTRLDM